MHHTFSKRNAFCTAIALGLGFTVAKILGALLMGGVMYAIGKLLA